MYKYILVVLVACVLTLIESTSLYNIKEYNIGGQPFNYLLAVGGYALIMLIMSKVLSFAKLGIINHLWNVTGSLTIFIVGYIFFKESLNKYELIGAIFSFIGLILMGIPEYQK